MTTFSLAHEIERLAQYNQESGADYPLTEWGVASVWMRCRASDALLAEVENEPWFFAADSAAFRACVGGSGGPAITLGNLAAAMPGDITANMIQLLRRHRELDEPAIIV